MTFGGSGTAIKVGALTGSTNGLAIAAAATGTFTFNGAASSYNGGVSIGGGTVVVATATAPFGTGTLKIDGGTFEADATNRTISVPTVFGDVGSPTINLGALTGSANLTFNSNNTFGGLGSNPTLNVNFAATQILTFSAAAAVAESFAGDISFNYATTSTVTFQGTDGSSAALSSVFGITNTSAAPNNTRIITIPNTSAAGIMVVTLPGILETDAASGTSSLAFQNNSGVAITFGSFLNNGGVAGAVSDPSLTLGGTGIFQMNGGSGCCYSGGTTINGGTVIINTSSTGTFAVPLNLAATGVASTNGGPFGIGPITINGGTIRDLDNVAARTIFNTVLIGPSGSPTINFGSLTTASVLFAGISTIGSSITGVVSSPTLNLNFAGGTSLRVGQMASPGGSISLAGDLTLNLTGPGSFAMVGQGTGSSLNLPNGSRTITVAGTSVAGAAVVFDSLGTFTSNAAGTSLTIQDNASAVPVAVQATTLGGLLNPSSGLHALRSSPPVSLPSPSIPPPLPPTAARSTTPPTAAASRCRPPASSLF